MKSSPSGALEVGSWRDARRTAFSGRVGVVDVELLDEKKVRRVCVCGSSWTKSTIVKSVGDNGRRRRRRISGGSCRLAVRLQVRRRWGEKMGETGWDVDV